MNSRHLHAFNDSNNENTTVVNTAAQSDTITIIRQVILSIMIVFGLSSAPLHCLCSFVVYRARLLSTDVKLLLYNVCFMAVIATLLIVRRAVNALFVDGVDNLQMFSTIDCIGEQSPLALCVNIIKCSVVGIGVERWLTNRSYFKIQPEDPPANDSWRVGAVAVGFCWMTGSLLESLFVISALLYVDRVPPTVWCSRRYMIATAPTFVCVGWSVFVVCSQLLGLVTFEYVGRQAQRMYDAYRQGATQNLETRYYLKLSIRLSSSLRLCVRLVIALNICMTVGRLVILRVALDDNDVGSSLVSALWCMWTQLVFQFSFGIAFPCALLASTQTSGTLVKKGRSCCLCRQNAVAPANGAENADGNTNNDDQPESDAANQNPPDQTTAIENTEITSKLKVVELVVEDLELQSL